MQPIKLLSFTASVLLATMSYAQQNSSNEKYSSGSSDISSALSFELFLGGTASFAHGDYIDYHRSFLSVEEEGTEFNGGIRPLIFGTAGIQAVVTPFKTEPLQNLGFSIGLQYVQKGFQSRFKMKYTSPADFTDLIDYTEIYQNHYVTIPIQVRYGKKWFGTLGLSISRQIISTRSQKMKHNQSGSGAVNGGFDITDSGKQKIDKSLINKSGTDFILGGGYRFNSNWSVALRANLGDEILNNVSDNYKTALIEFSIFTKL